MGEVVALAVHFFRQLDALHRAHGYTDSAALAALGIDNDLSFKCHNFNVIRLIFEFLLLQLVPAKIQNKIHILNKIDNNFLNFHASGLNIRLLAHLKNHSILLVRTKCLTTTALVRCHNDISPIVLR